MQNFVDRARDLALAPGAEADSLEEWASRAFSVIAILGSMDDINDEVGESLAITLSKAPTSVVSEGTMKVIYTQMLANKF